MSKRRSAQSSFPLAVIAFAVVAVLGIGFLYTNQHLVTNILGISSVAPATTFAFSPTQVSVSTGQSFKETITVDSGGNKLSSVNLEVTYNPTYFEVTAFSINSGNPLFPMPGPSSIDNTTGKAVLFLQSGTVSASGKADVATVTFRNKQAFPPTQPIKFGTGSSARESASTVNMLIGTVPAAITNIPAPVPSTTSKITPTSTTKLCSPEIQTFAVDTPCGSNSFRYASVTCQSGYTIRDGGPTSCKPISTWSTYAIDTCKAHTTCVQPSVKPVSCVGQCKGDPAGTSYPPGKACIGMDSLCYLCGTNGSFSVTAASACGTQPSPTRSPTPKLSPTPTAFYKITPPPATPTR